MSEIANRAYEEEETELNSRKDNENNNSKRSLTQNIAWQRVIVQDENHTHKHTNIHIYIYTHMRSLSSWNGSSKSIQANDFYRNIVVVALLIHTIVVVVVVVVIDVNALPITIDVSTVFVIKLAAKFLKCAWRKKMKWCQMYV